MDNMDNKNKLTKFNKVVFIACCIAFSILFSFFAIKYIDFKSMSIDEEKAYGDTTCPSGFYVTGGNSSGVVCSACPEGYSCPDGYRSICKAGTYASGTGNTSCTACPSGYTTRQEGSTSENDCVKVCKPGYYLDSSANTCKMCEPGTYTDSYSSKTCKLCPKGYYQDESGQTSCDMCDTGTYQNEEGQSSCKSCVGSTYTSYQDEKGKSECKSCNPNEYSDDGKSCSPLECAPGSYKTNTQCALCEKGFYCFGSKNSCADGFTTKTMGSATKSECSVKLDNIKDCTVSLSTDKRRVSAGDDYKIKAKLTGSQCSGQELTLKIIKAKFKSHGKKVNEYSIRLADETSHEIEVSTEGRCVLPEVTATLTNGQSVTLKKTYVTGKWDAQEGIPKTGEYNKSTHTIDSADEADELGFDVYYSDEKACSWNDELGVNETCYTKKHERHGCDGNFVPDNPRPSSNNACYMNKTTGKLVWGDYSSKSDYEKVSNITKKEDCKNISVDDCEDSIIIPTSETKKITCNGNANFEGTASKSCEINKSPYYKISCLEKLSTNLVPGLTGTIKLGLGFNYNIKITSIRECKGEFYFDEFTKAYDIVKRNLNTYPNGTRDYQTYLNKKKDLEKMVDDYNKWASDYNLDNIKASLSDKQLDKSINFVVKKDSLKITRGTKINTKTHKLNITGIDNPINFDYTETLSKELILPVAYYNQQTNTISYTNCSNCVEMSNQYFISNDKKYIDKDYKYEVALTGLGYSKNWKVTTNDCSLKVKDDTKIYRPTDIDDPFLNSANPERETGENWLNETFDFTKIIKSDTWQKKPLYEFNITTANVKEIKKNNSELGANAYLGLDCKLVTSRNKYYCEFLRNSKYFQYHYIYSDNLN